MVFRSYRRDEGDSGVSSGNAKGVGLRNIINRCKWMNSWQK